MSIQKFGNRTYVDIDVLGANLGYVDTAFGLVLIDTPFLPDDISQWEKTCTELSEKGVAYVINTHHHFDHVLGNLKYTPNIIAHQAAYDEMTRPDGTMCHFFVPRRKDIPDDIKEQVYKIPVVLPNVTFNDSMRLNLGDINIELIHMGGHTDSSIFVRVIEDRIVFTGDDFVSNSQPFMGQADFKRWIEVLESLHSMDVDIIIPGHGEVRDKAEVERMLLFLQQMRDRVQKLRQQGQSREKIIELVHDHIDYYPLSVGEEEIQIMLFDEAIGKLYDQLGKPA